jgi:hypothetical protein
MIAREIFDQLPSLSAAITCDAEAIGELVEKQCETRLCDFQLQLICFLNAPAITPPLGAQ